MTPLCGRRLAAGLIAGSLMTLLASLPSAADTAPLPGPLGQAVARLMADSRLHGPSSSALLEHELVEGLKMFRAGKHDRAALSFARAVRESPRHPVSNFCLSVALLGMRRFDEAAVSLARSLRLARHDQWKAMALDLRKAYGDAFSPLRTAVEKWGGTKHQTAQALLSVFLQRFGGQPIKARVAAASLVSKLPVGHPVWQSVRRLFPTETRPRAAKPADKRHLDPFVRGVYLFYNGRYDEAGDLFSEAYIAEPSFVRASYFLSHALFAQKKYDLASKLLVRSLRRGSSWVGQAIVLREYYRDPDSLDDQIDDLRKQLQANPTPRRFMLLAYIRYADGQYQAARVLFHNLVQSLGKRDAAIRSLAQLMVDWTDRQIRGEVPRISKGLPDAPGSTNPGTPGTKPKVDKQPPGTKKPTQGPTALKQPDKPDPATRANPEELLEQCALRLKQGRYGDAKKVIEQFFGSKKATARAYFLRARVHLALGQFAYGGMAVRNGISLTTDLERLRLDWARYFPSAEVFKAHVKKLDEHVKFEQLELNSRFLAGVIHYDLGQYSEALKEFKAILLADPSEKQARTYISLISKKVDK